MPYIDGYLLVVPKKNVKAYKRMATTAGKVWREHGALEYKECVADDINVKWGAPYPKLLKLKAGETVFFSYIVYKNRKDRDRINAKVMKDPRLAPGMNEKNMPFDMKRMSMGGFKPLVDL